MCLNIKTFLAITAIGVSLTPTVKADFYDNFDSYADQAAFASTWTIDTGTLNLSSAQSVSAPNSIVWASSASARAHRAVGGTIAASALDWSFRFDDVGATRDFNCLYANTGGWGVGVQSVLAFGDYNTVAGKYEGRYSAITGAQYGDGAATDGGTGGWFSLNATRANGWHLFEVKGQADLLNGAGKVKFSFFIDNALVGSVANLADYNFNWATIGGAVSVGTTGGATDDFGVSTVPEPSSMAFGLLGVLAFMVRFIARRKSF